MPQRFLVSIFTTIKLFGVLCVSIMAAASAAHEPIRIVVEGTISVIRLAPHFTTTIRLPDWVSSVALGDPAVFQAEHSQNEPLLVFVKPLTNSPAQTNLLISTVNHRYFTLILKTDAADNEASVDLLVECRPTRSPFIEDQYATSLIADTVSLLASGEKKSGSVDVTTEGTFSELLDRQSKRSPSKFDGDKIRVSIGEVLDSGGRAIVVFSVLNAGTDSVELMPPQIQLAGHGKRQPKGQRGWTTVDQVPVENFQLTSRRLERGARSNGLVVFRRPSMKRSDESLLLQIADSAAIDQPVLVPFDFTGKKTLEENHE